MERNKLRRFKFFLPLIAVTGLLTMAIPPMANAVAMSITSVEVNSVVSSVISSGGGDAVLINGTGFGDKNKGKITLSGAATMELLGNDPAIDWNGTDIHFTSPVCTSGDVTLTVFKNLDKDGLVDSGTEIATWPLTCAASYVVHFNSQGGTAVSDGSFVGGGTVTLPTAPTYTGYTFLGWFAAASGGDALTFPYAPGVTHDITLYAHWSANSYTVHFDSQGGSAVSDGTYLTGGHITAPPDPTKASNYFLGWFLASSGGTALDLTTYVPPIGGITLYAQWSETPAVFTVHFNSQGGSAVPDGTYTAGGHITKPADPTRATYTFLGWFNDTSGGTAIDFTTYLPPSGGITLYAQWTPVSIPPTTYTVTYSGNTNTGGSVPIDGSSYVLGNTVTVLGNTGSLVKSGYTFAHWNTQANDLGTAYSPGATFVMGAASVILYAQWTPVSVPPVTPTVVESGPFTLAYNGNGNTGGTVPAGVVTYPKGATVTVLGNTGSLVKTGYVFTHWHINSGAIGLSYSAGDTFAIMTNTVLYAQWDPVAAPTPTPTPTPTPAPAPTPVATATLHVVVEVINENTGTAVPSDFLMHVTHNSTEVTDSPAAGLAAPGRAYVLPVGDYLVSQDPVEGYIGAFTGTFTNGLVTLAAGDDVTITRTVRDSLTPAVIPAEAPTTTPTTTTTGGTLPKTSTPWYNLLAVSLGLTLLGGFTWSARRRQQI